MLERGNPSTLPIKTFFRGQHSLKLSHLLLGINGILSHVDQDWVSGFITRHARFGGFLAELRHLANSDLLASTKDSGKPNRCIFWATNCAFQCALPTTPDPCFGGTSFEFRPHRPLSPPARPLPLHLRLASAWFPGDPGELNKRPQVGNQANNETSIHSWGFQETPRSIDFAYSVLRFLTF